MIGTPEFSTPPSPELLAVFRAQREGQTAGHAFRSAEIEYERRMANGRLLAGYVERFIAEGASPCPSA
jgi:hypothetical protein